MTISLSSECRIVFLAAGGVRADDELRAMLGEAVDWDRVIGLATYNKAAGALDGALARIGSPLVPGSARVLLRRQRMVGDFHVSYLRARLLETLAALRSRNVDVLLLKGAALGATVYESYIDRPMADVDLLIREKHREAACAALGASGWTAESDPSRADLYAEHHHLPPFSDTKGSGHRLELHLAPFPPPNPFGPVDKMMWREASAAPPEFSGALVPSPAHMLVYACVHFAWSHMLTRGAWRTFRDLFALSDAAVDWDEVVHTAKAWKAASACYWTLRMARTLSSFGSVPAEVLRQMRPPMPELLGTTLDRHFVAQLVPGERPTCPSARAVELLWRAAIRPGWSGHGPQTRKSGSGHWRLLRHDDAPAAHDETTDQGIGAWRDYLAAIGFDRRPTSIAKNSLPPSNSRE